MQTNLLDFFSFTERCHSHSNLVNGILVDWGEKNRSNVHPQRKKYHKNSNSLLDSVL